jgi:protein ERP2
MMIMTPFWTILTILATTIAADDVKSISFTFEVPNRDKHCFFEEFDGPADYTFSYIVIRGGIRDITVEVIYQNEDDPRGPEGERRVREPLYHQKQKVKDKIEMTIEPGTYVFCFANDFSRLSHKVVSFALYPTNSKRQRRDAKQTKSQIEHTLMETSCQRLASTMMSMRGHQREQTVNDAQGYDVAVMLNAHVLRWSLLQLCIFLMLGIGQVYVLKTFFTESTASMESSHPSEQIIPQNPTQRF